MIDELPESQKVSYGKGYRICRDYGLLDNFILLNPSEMSRSYYNSVYIFPTISCDFIIFVIVLLTQFKKIKKYDVTEY